MDDLTAVFSAADQMPNADIPAPAFEYPNEAIISYAQTREDVLLWCPAFHKARVLH
jgi:hypothetical protein